MSLGLPDEKVRRAAVARTLLASGRGAMVNDVFPALRKYVVVCLYMRGCDGVLSENSEN